MFKHFTEDRMEAVKTIDSKQYQQNCSRCCVKKFTDFQVKQEYCENSRTRTCANGCTSNPILPVITRRLTLPTIEHLYRKYFSESVQHNIVVVANILNIMTVFDKHYTTGMFDSIKNTDKEEILKKKQYILEMREGYTNILKSKLKQYLVRVISKFEISEFESAFQIVLSSILTVLKVLDQARYKNRITTGLFLLCRLLWNNLNDTEFDRVKVLLISTKFRTNCVSLINLIGFSREFDLGLPKRMTVFFVSSDTHQEHYRAVVNGMNSFESYENLQILIDTAAFKCRNNSKFQNPTLVEVNSTPTMKKNANVRPSVCVVPSILKSNSDLIQWKMVEFLPVCV